MAAIVLPPTCRLGALHISSNSPALTFLRLPLHLVPCYDQRWPAGSLCWPAGAREASSFRFARLAWTPHLDDMMISGVGGTHRCRYLGVLPREQQNRHCGAFVGRFSTLWTERGRSSRTPHTKAVIFG